MYLTEEINEARAASGRIAKEYAEAATYGNATDEMLFELVRINAFIGVMSRNQTSYISIPATSDVLQGQKVSLSSLSKTNNTLFLDISTAPCVEIEIEPCLSDDELCKIVDQVKMICYKS